MRHCLWVNRNGSVKGASHLTGHRSLCDLPWSPVWSQVVMVDPVVAPCCGESFERAAAEERAAAAGTCAACGAPLAAGALVPNRPLRNTLASLTGPRRSAGS